MKLTLRIENLDSLPDGGPLEFSAMARGFEVGRDSAMDWTLPDPNRHISSRHFEVTFRDGQFWLNDISTNGTFIYGASMRVSSPLALTHNERLQVGQYIIRVLVVDPAAQALRPAPRAPVSDPWSLAPSPVADAAVFQHAVAAANPALAGAGRAVWRQFRRKPAPGGVCADDPAAGCADCPPANPLPQAVTAAARAPTAPPSAPPAPRPRPNRFR